MRVNELLLFNSPDEIKLNTTLVNTLSNEILLSLPIFSIGLYLSIYSIN